MEHQLIHTMLTYVKGLSQTNEAGLNLNRQMSVSPDESELEGPHPAYTHDGILKINVNS